MTQQERADILARKLRRAAEYGYASLDYIRQELLVAFKEIEDELKDDCEDAY